MEIGQSQRISGQILCLEGIYSWKPDDGAPSQVEAKVVMTDIDRPKVPVFIDEKIHHIQSVQSCGDEDRICYITMKLILVCNEREIANSTLATLQTDNVCSRLSRYKKIFQITLIVIFEGGFQGSYINVQAMIPGLPFVNSLKSKYSPNLGFNSMPIYMSYKTDPDYISFIPAFLLVVDLPLNFLSPVCVGLK